MTYTVNESGSSGLPDFITFDEANEEFTFSPDGDDSGTYTIEVAVTDTLGFVSTTDTFDVVVTDNVLPTYNVIGDQEFREEEDVSVDVTASFTNTVLCTAETWSATLYGSGSLPIWLNFNTATQEFTADGDDTVPGLYDIEITIADEVGSASEVFRLRINNKPYVNEKIPDQDLV